LNLLIAFWDKSLANAMIQLSSLGDDLPAVKRRGEMIKKVNFAFFKTEKKH